MTHHLKALLIISLISLGGCASTEFRDGNLNSEIYGTNVSDYERGKIDFAAKRFGLALKHFKKALTQAHKNVKVLNAIAATYDKMNRFDISKRYYQMALTVDPQSSVTLSNFGYSYYMQRKHDVAKVLLREAAAKSNDKWTGHANLKLLNQTVEADNKKHEANSANIIRHQVHVAKVSSIFTPPSIDRAQRPAAGSQPRSKAPVLVKKLQLIRTAAGTHTIFTRHHPGITQNTIPDIPVKPLRQSETRSEMAPHSDASFIKTKIAKLTTEAPGKNPEPKAPLQQSSKISETVKMPAQNHKRKRSVSIIISNGTGRARMAARMRGHLSKNGYQMMWLGNADNYRKRVTTVFYKEGLKNFAELLAAQLPAAVQLIERTDQRTSLQLELAADLLEFDKELIRQLKKVQTDA